MYYLQLAELGIIYHVVKPRNNGKTMLEKKILFVNVRTSRWDGGERGQIVGDF